MKKTIAIAFIILYLGGMVFASEIDYKEKFSQTKYFPDENTVITKTVYANYENEDRHSTYDLRHGYTYRITSAYWKEVHEISTLDDYDLDEKRIYRTYRRDYDRNYNEERDCYYSAPKGKLFYIRC